ncbi:helix-turn-helix transcriptional regulator [Nocardia sp. NPDC050799]|uniref:helix-turn-helix transcriptional regulator n=1 Tax=Nocardia sp. NPDC050799 TaxID=3154842 RepID=UPI0033ECA52A
MDSAVHDAVRTIADAAARFGVPVRSATHGIRDTGTALAALDALERVLAKAPEQAPGAVLELRAARAELLAYELGRQRSMLDLLAKALAGMRTATTVDDLVEAVPIQVTSLGYERAMFSWVDRERWVPRAMHTLSGPQEARAILAAGAGPYRHVRDLLEVDVVRRRRAILVLDADRNPRVHPTITPVSRSTTYVAAPVVARNHVAAFVHLDRSVSTGANDEFDRDLLSYFCDSLGVVLDRLLATRRDTPGGPVSEWADALTAREREVLELLSDGLPNAGIAARLFLSEETVKTHVKKLMRKLGVANRAQAAALYHRAAGAQAIES